MAKKDRESVIALETEKFESKIEQFQDYLDRYDIRYIEDDKKRHDETDSQIKIMNALPVWLLGLAKLRENKNENKKLEVRADSELSGLMQKEFKIT